MHRLAQFRCNVTDTVSVATAYKIPQSVRSYSAGANVRRWAVTAPPCRNCQWQMDRFFFFQLHKLAATSSWTAAAVRCGNIVHAQKQMDFQNDYEAASIAVRLWNKYNLFAFVIWIYSSIEFTEKMFRILIKSVFSCKIRNFLSWQMFCFLFWLFLHQVSVSTCVYLMQIYSCGHHIFFSVIAYKVN